ncbi:MAG TPA: peroxiredoxin [Methylophilaceae bacterium]|nr:peroxiredoxin [Methylophilaceae bacterium]
MHNLQALPQDLPVPEDDGACNHLPGATLPADALASTQGGTVDLAAIKGWLVVYCYPMTGRPDVALPDGWDAIPGARGCTPQSCSFRDQYQELSALNTQVFGLSTQATEYQQEAANRLHLPFPLLSDVDFAFTNALVLPTFTTGNMRLNKRVTLIAYDGVIQHYFYPVFPPDKNADEVLAWLKRYV